MALDWIYIPLYVSEMTGAPIHTCVHLQAMLFLPAPAQLLAEQSSC